MGIAGARQGEGRHRVSDRHKEPEGQETRDIQCSPLTRREVGVHEDKLDLEGGERAHIHRALGLLP